MTDEWQPIETAPEYKSVWVATTYDGYGTGFMEPCFRTVKGGVWRNIYTKAPIVWVPEEWMPLPSPPNQNQIPNINERGRE